jgi:hypothetical protein
MSKRQGDFDKREIRLPDGRRLIYYGFPDAPRQPQSALPFGPETPPTRVGPRRPEEG